MRVFLIALSLSLPLLAFAGPAPYYQWQSKADGTVICRQTSPGHGWELLNGQPYRDLKCTLPAGRVDRPLACQAFCQTQGADESHGSVPVTTAQAATRACQRLVRSICRG